MKVNIQSTVQNLNTDMKPMEVDIQLTVQNLNTEVKIIMIQTTLALNKESFESAQTSQCHIR